MLTLPICLSNLGLYIAQVKLTLPTGTLTSSMGVVLISRLTINLHKTLLRDETVGGTVTGLTFWGASSVHDAQNRSTGGHYEQDEIESIS